MINRGIPVISVIRPIVGTNWYLIAKEDRDEILASTTALARYLVLVMALAIAMTIFLVAYRYNFQQKKSLPGFIPHKEPSSGSAGRNQHHVIQYW